MRISRFFIVLILIFLSQLSLAQNNKKIDSLIGVANTFIFKNPHKTIQIGEELLKKKNISDSYRISSYVLIANGFAALNNYKSSIDYALKANQLSEKTKDNANQIRTLGLIGNQYTRIEMREEAWKYLDKADKLTQTISLPDSMKYLIGNINLLKGFLYKRSLDCGYAIKHFNKAIAAFKKDKKGFAVANLGQAYNQKGYCYLSINKDSAEISFQKGLEDARKNGAKSLECNALIGLSEIETDRNNFRTSTDTLFYALKLAKEVNQTEMETRIYKLLSNNFIATGNFEDHLKYKKLYESAQSKFALENIKSVNELIKNRNDYKQKIYRSDQVRFIRIILILLVVLIIIIFLFGYFLVKKVNK